MKRILESVCEHLNIIFSFPIISPSALDEQFEQFIMKFGKKYLTREEYERRRDIFYANLKEIEEHNERKTSTYTKGVNQFTDLTKEEFAASIRGMLKSDLHLHTVVLPSLFVT